MTTKKTTTTAPKAKKPAKDKVETAQDATETNAQGDQATETSNDTQTPPEALQEAPALPEREVTLTEGNDTSKDRVEIESAGVDLGRGDGTASVAIKFSDGRVEHVTADLEHVTLPAGWIAIDDDGALDLPESDDEDGPDLDRILQTIWLARLAVRDGDSRLIVENLNAAIQMLETGTYDPKTMDDVREIWKSIERRSREMTFRQVGTLTAA